MSSHERKRSLSQRRVSGQYLTPLNIPPCDDSEPVRPVVRIASDLDMDNKNVVVEEGQALFKRFVFEQIQIEEPVVLEDAHLLSLFQGYSNPTWAKTGYDLRQMADQFARSKKRQRVRERAQQMGVDVSQNEFRDLLSELFAQGGVSAERIILLFYFCSDVAINALHAGRNILMQFVNWSLNFIIEQVCQWVYSQGGWGQVLRTSFNSKVKIAIWVTVASVAVIVTFRYFKSRS